MEAIANQPARTSNPIRTVAGYITWQLELCGKTQTQVAQECGFELANIITMIKQDKTNLPISKVHKMAKALGVDPKYLFKLAYKEYRPEEWAMFEELMGQPVLTQNEVEMIEVIRSAGMANPKLSPKNKEDLVKFAESLKDDV